MRNREVIQKRVNVLFKEFTNETKERYRLEMEGEDGGGEDLGIGTTNEDFHSSATKPEEMDRLKM